jgi:hypothetical protein
VLIASAALVTLHLATRTCRLDGYTFTIVIVAFSVLLYPDLYTLVSRLRRVKAGGFELILDPAQTVKVLKDEADDAQRSLAGKSDYFGFPPYAETSPEARRLLDKGEAKAAFLTLDRETEIRLRELAAMNEVPSNAPLRRTLEELVRREILPSKVIDLFTDVRAVRNKLVHEPGFRPSQTEIADLVQVAQRLHHMVHYIPC